MGDKCWVSGFGFRVFGCWCDQGCAIFASGSPFGPVEVDGKPRLTGQSNNAYIFPGMGLGCMVGEAIRIHDDMFLVAGTGTSQYRHKSI